MNNGKQKETSIVQHLVNKLLNEENIKMKKCLQDIANEDFRGNRSSASTKAYNCLEEIRGNK